MTRILCIGDIIGKPGRKVVKHMVAKLRKEGQIDFVIANSDNVTSGKGINQDHLKEMLKYGIDIFTAGNHIWQHRDIIEELERKEPTILRPGNFPTNNPGKGWRVINIPGTKISIATINLQCRSFMGMTIECPFHIGDQILNEPEVKQAQIKVIDIHGETTSEKQALFRYFDGRISHIFGTHTHVQTNDAQISSKGTSFMTDIGGCLAENSVIGFEIEGSIRKFLTQMPERYEVEEKGPAKFCGCIVDIDETNGKAQHIEPITVVLTP